MTNHGTSDLDAVWTGWHRCATGFALGACLLLASGCGPSEKPCLVSGQVVVNGRPAEGVYVVLHGPGEPEGQTSASTRTGRDGVFSLQVSGPGDYALTLFWPSVTVEANETIEGEDRFKGRYRDPHHRFQKVAIREGDNSLAAIKVKAP